MFPNDERGAIPINIQQHHHHHYRTHEMGKYNSVIVIKIWQLYVAEQLNINAKPVSNFDKCIIGVALAVEQRNGLPIVSTRPIVVTRVCAV